MIPATFRAAFAALEPQDVLTVLSWILEPGVGDPSPEMPDEWLDATLPLTKAYQAAYSAMEYSVDADGSEFWGDDHWADEADHRFDCARDDAMVAAWERAA